VPVSRTESLATVADNQKELDVLIYQGESRLVQDNVFLGKINLKLTPRKAGEVTVDVRFTYDVSGVLEAEVTLPATGERHQLVITENAGVMTPTEIEQRFAELAELKIHPRDQIENRALVTRADRMYEQALGDVREFIAARTIEFQAALETQDPATVRSAVAELRKALQQLEDEGYL
jgi:molecular chaperone HscC